MKNTIFTPLLSKLHPKTLKTSLPPPTTIDGHHKLSLLSIGPPHRKEQFNQSKIFRIHLKDLVENGAPNIFLRGFFVVILTSMPFS